MNYNFKSTTDNSIYKPGLNLTLCYSLGLAVRSEFPLTSSWDMLYHHFLSSSDLQGLCSWWTVCYILVCSVLPKKPAAIVFCGPSNDELLLPVHILFRDSMTATGQHSGNIQWLWKQKRQHVITILNILNLFDKSVVIYRTKDLCATCYITCHTETPVSVYFVL